MPSLGKHTPGNLPSCEGQGGKVRPERTIRREGKSLKSEENNPGYTSLGRSRPGGEAQKAAGRPKKQPERLALSQSLRYQVLKRDDFRCRLCGVSPEQDRAVRLEVDHIVPVSRGGTNDPHNLQTLCRECNQGKRDRL